MAAEDSDRGSHVDGALPAGIDAADGRDQQRDGASAMSLRERQIGTWTVAEISTADGRASPPFSEAPEVFLIFAPLSHTLRFASDVPKIACYNRLSPDA